jgi:hypothetical protein
MKKFNVNKIQQIITQQNHTPQKTTNTELIRQRAISIREEYKFEDEEREQSERESKKWILLTIIILFVVLNITTFGKIVPWIISNLFILFYVIYFFFGKKVKEIGEWLDDKLNQ